MDSPLSLAAAQDQSNEFLTYIGAFGIAAPAEAVHKIQVVQKPLLWIQRGVFGILQTVYKVCQITAVSICNLPVRDGMNIWHL